MGLISKKKNFDVNEILNYKILVGTIRTIAQVLRGPIIITAEFNSLK